MPVTHKVEYFCARIARTACGIYVGDEQITAFPAQVSCKNCRRTLPKPRRFQGTKLY